MIKFTEEDLDIWVQGSTRLQAVFLQKTPRQGFTYKDMSLGDDPRMP